MANNIFYIASPINEQTYLKRPHIHKLLADSLEKPITTVVAGAGYGKTQAVYAFLQEYDAVTIWLQLSPFDNLPLRLWDNLASAVSLQNKELALNLKSLGFPETMVAYHRFLDLFSNEIKRGKKYVFVYDDFHLIHEKTILDFFTRVINARIPNLSIIFIARSEPELNTIGLLSKGMLSSINEEDLRFRENEIIHYFQTQDIRLSPGAISDIYNYTGGWIFAIHLVGLSLISGLLHENYALSKAKVNIFKLIESEIFYPLSGELRDFLVKLSLLEDLPLDLLRELSSNNDMLLSEMERISSFVRYDAFINTYRIHHLFLSFLSEKQSALKADEKKQIYIKAANWYLKNGHKIDAITYYDKAGCYDEIIDIALAYNFPSPCPKKTAEFMIDMFEKFPQGVYDKRPIIAILHAKFLLNNFRVKESYAMLLTLRAKYEAFPPTDENKAILGEIYISLGFLNFITCFLTGEYEFKQLFKMADELLPSGSVIVHSNLHLNSGNYVCWVSRPKKGAYERLHEALCYTMPYASRVMNGSGYGFENLALAESCYFQNDFKNAEIYANQAIYKSQEKDQFDIEIMAAFYLIRINMAVGNYKKISSLLKQLRLLAERQNCSECYTLLDIAQGWFYSGIGQTQKVAGWITQDLEDSDGTSPVTFAIDRVVRARCYLAQNKYDELLAFTEQRDGYSVEDFLVGLIEMTVLKAIALYHLDEPKRALTVLQEAYELAHPDSLIMPFIEQGNQARALINTAIDDKDRKIPIEWLRTVHTKASTYAKKLAIVIMDDKMSNGMGNDIQPNLTTRETQVLTDLCHGLTKTEIAAKQNLSVNTVKNMLVSIHEKLGVKNNLDAVRVASLMKLIN